MSQHQQQFLDPEEFYPEEERLEKEERKAHAQKMTKKHLGDDGGWGPRGKRERQPNIFSGYAQPRVWFYMYYRCCRTMTRDNSLMWTTRQVYGDMLPLYQEAYRKALTCLRHRTGLKIRGMK